MAKAGGAPSTIYAHSDESLQNVSLDGPAIFWTNESPAAVMALPLSGGIATTLALVPNSMQDLTSLFAVNGTVFWTVGGTVAAVAESGGTPRTIASGQPQPTGVLADADYVYWSDATLSGEAAVGTILKAPLGGGAPITLASGQPNPLMSAIDGSYVYWTNFTPPQSNGTVVRIPKEGGTAVTLATGQGAPWAIALNSGGIYWTDSLSNTVMGCSTDGSKLQTLATNQESALNIAADSANVYWTTAGTVMRLPLSCTCE
jgi:hypothetical protein